MSKVTLISRPEFASEITCIVPYAYWLHQQGKLEKVITCKGMKPFYYFCDTIEEFDERHLDHRQSGMDLVPNNWIHRMLENPGVLDYSEWKLPPYKEHYKNDEFNFGKTIMILNCHRIILRDTYK